MNALTASGQMTNLTKSKYSIDARKILLQMHVFDNRKMVRAIVLCKYWAMQTENEYYPLDKMVVARGQFKRSKLKYRTAISKAKTSKKSSMTFCCWALWTTQSSPRTLVTVLNRKQYNQAKPNCEQHVK